MWRNNTLYQTSKGVLKTQSRDLTGHSLLIPSVLCLSQRQVLPGSDKVRIPNARSVQDRSLKCKMVDILDFPDELLINIIEAYFVEHGDTQASLPIAQSCKRLRQLSLPILFQSLKADGCRALKTQIRMILANPALTAHVRSVSIKAYCIQRSSVCRGYFDPEFSSPVPALPPVETPLMRFNWKELLAISHLTKNQQRPSPTPEQAQLWRFFNSRDWDDLAAFSLPLFNNLESLELHQEWTSNTCPKVLARVLTLPEDKNLPIFLPRLRRLKLRFDSQTSSEKYNMNALLPLLRLPTLEIISLHSFSEWTHSWFDAPHASSDDKSKKVRLSIKTLEIVDGFQAKRWSDGSIAVRSLNVSTTTIVWNYLPWSGSMLGR